MAETGRSNYELLSRAQIEYAIAQEDPRAAEAVTDANSASWRQLRISRAGGGIAITTALDEGPLSEAETLQVVDYTLSADTKIGAVQVDELHYEGHGVRVKPVSDPTGAFRSIDELL